MGKVILVNFGGSRSKGKNKATPGCATCGGGSTSKAATPVVPQKQIDAQMERIAPRASSIRINVSPTTTTKVPEPEQVIEATIELGEDAVVGISKSDWQNNTAAKIARMALRVKFEEYALENGLFEYELISTLKEVEIVKAIKTHLGL